MGIEKGQPWEQPMPPGTPVVAVADDAAAANIVANARRSGRPAPTIHIANGDIARSLGGAPVDGVGDAPQLRCAMDAFEVVLSRRGETTQMIGVAHVVVRRPLWTGGFSVVMNATHLGEMNLGPRAHPGDGVLDVTEGRLRLTERVEARRRAPSGSHLPHPDLSARRVTSSEVQVPRGATVFVDGRRVCSGPATAEIGILPDSWWWAVALPV